MNLSRFVLIMLVFAGVVSGQDMTLQNEWTDRLVRIAPGETRQGWVPTDAGGATVVVYGLEPGVSCDIPGQRTMTEDALTGGQRYILPNDDSFDLKMLSCTNRTSDFQNVYWRVEYEKDFSVGVAPASPSVSNGDSIYIIASTPALSPGVRPLLQALDVKCFSPLGGEVAGGVVPGYDGQLSTGAVTRWFSCPPIARPNEEVTVRLQYIAYWNKPCSPGSFGCFGIEVVMRSATATVKTFDGTPPVATGFRIGAYGATGVRLDWELRDDAPGRIDDLLLGLDVEWNGQVQTIWGDQPEQPKGRSVTWSQTIPTHALGEPGSGQAGAATLVGYRLRFADHSFVVGTQRIQLGWFTAPPK